MKKWCLVLVLCVFGVVSSLPPQQPPFHLSPATALQPPLVVIIGSGASGFYAAQKLMDQGNRVVMISQDMAIGGGTRFLIRPDKVKLKKGMLRKFVQTLKHPLFEGYFGGIQVGQNKEIRLEDLLRLNPSLIYLASGSRGSKRLSFIDPNMKGIYDAYQIAQIYNLAPEWETFPLEINGHVGILGVGNVTADMVVWIAFINRLQECFKELNRPKVALSEIKTLLIQKSPQKQFAQFIQNFDYICEILDRLEFIAWDRSGQTAIPLQRLWNSKAEQITLFARRGPFEFKMNPKEVKEILPFVDMKNLTEDIKKVLKTIYAEEKQLNQSNRSLPYFTQTPYRLSGNLDKDTQTVLARLLTPALLKKVQQGDIQFDTNLLKIRFRFLTQPRRLIQHGRNQKLTSILLSLNKLTLDPVSNRVTSEPVDGDTMKLDTFIYSIGSVIDPNLGIPLNNGWPIPSEQDPYTIDFYSEGLDKTVPLRVSGWARQPSTGLAGQAKKDAALSTESLSLKRSRMRADDLETLFKNKGLSWVSKEEVLVFHEKELRETLSFFTFEIESKNHQLIANSI